MCFYSNYKFLLNIALSSCILILFSALMNPAFAGDDLVLPNKLITYDKKSAVKIVSVEVYGNKRTKNYVILRELKLKPGHLATLDDIEIDRKRIQNLGLFTRVEMYARQETEGIVLQIVVTERWHIFPYPIFYRNEKDWKKLSYGFGLSYYNFRGRNESFSSDFWLGYNPGLSLGYSNPWFGGKWRLYSQFNIYLGTVKSKNLYVESLDEKQFRIRYILGKRFGYHTFIDFGLEYKTLTTTAEEVIYTLDQSGRDRWFSYHFQIRYDKRDLHEYPHSGAYLSAYVKKAGHKGYVINYSHYGADLRIYIPLTSSWTFALRSACDLSRGLIPIYDHTYLGYNERIRGYFYDQFEGENRMMGGAAIRFPIRKITYHTFFQDTPFRDYYRNLKFGISGELFIDSGMVWYQSEEPKKKKLLTGFGAGIHFHLPYVYLLRLEYGFNKKDTGQWILFDVGVPF